MAGLPATGKSTIARELAVLYKAPLFDKDRVREAVFGPYHVGYTREQNDLVMRMLYLAVEHLAASRAVPLVLLDGRTYSRRYQVAELAELARRLEAELVVIECFAARETVRERLAADDVSAGTPAHPAHDRTFERWLELEAASDPIEIAAVRLETSRLSLSESIEACRLVLDRRA